MSSNDKTIALDRIIDRVEDIKQNREEEIWGDVLEQLEDIREDIQNESFKEGADKLDSVIDDLTEDDIVSEPLEKLGTSHLVIDIRNYKLQVESWI